MTHYTIISSGFRNFILTLDNIQLAELIYPKWFSFKAEINLANETQLLLEPKGFWESKIELKNGEEVLLDFKLGWKGIMFKVKSEGFEENYLLKHKGILNSRYVLVDTRDQELLAVKSDFHWSTFKLDYEIETSDEFERLKLKEAFLLTIIHSINYQMSMVAATA